MAAGLGFKTFVTGEVLTAADTNGYLMQGVNVFADAAARTAAITSPEEGQMSYLKDTNATEYYTGSAWAAVGTSGSLTSLATGTVSSTSVVLSSISQSYNHLYLVVTSAQLSSSTEMLYRLNADTGSNYATTGFGTGATTVVNRTADTSLFSNGASGPGMSASANNDTYTLFIENYSLAKGKGIYMSSNLPASKTDNRYTWGAYQSSTAITSITMTTSAGTATFSVGTYTLYGVK